MHNETGDIDKEEIVPHNLQHFSNNLQDDVSSHKHEPEMDNEEAMVLEFVKDEEETFSTYVVKEEFHNHYDSQVVVLSHVENNFNDEINEHSLECFHYASNSLEDHQNDHLVDDPYEDQSFVQQIVGNIFCVEDQPCNEEKHELLASSFEISQNAPFYDEYIEVLDRDQHIINRFTMKICQSMMSIQIKKSISLHHLLLI